MGQRHTRTHRPTDHDIHTQTLELSHGHPHTPVLVSLDSTYCRLSHTPTQSPSDSPMWLQSGLRRPQGALTLMCALLTADTHNAS